MGFLQVGDLPSFDADRQLHISIPGKLHNHDMVRLHIGSGPTRIPDWINIDNLSYPGVDRVLDVRDGLPYRDVEYIFCEHFIEHLTLSQGFEFLRESRRALSDQGVFRLSTPNLDWVWLTHYSTPPHPTEDHAITGSLELNRAFHGWGHKFLYNESTLAAALRACGFANITRHEYGASGIPELRNLERHEKSPDHPLAQHILILEATGRSTEDASFKDRVAPYIRDSEVT